jgi:Tfp pilus assembly protein PilF
VRKALDHDARNLANRGDLGMVLYRQTRYPGAAESLEQAIDGHPDAVDRARWWIVLAMSQHRLGQSRAAQESYHRARSELADAKTSAAAAAELARLWAEADAALHAGTRLERRLRGQDQ